MGAVIPKLAVVMVFLAAVVAVVPACGAAQDSCDHRPEFRNLRYEENWRYLADPACMEDPFDWLKFIPVDATGSHFLTLGGEARLRYEYVHNGAFGADVKDSNGYFLKRYLMHADFYPADRLRTFVQLQSANESGRVGGPRAEDEDNLDVNQPFVDRVFHRQDEHYATLRVGRQELEFGLSRLLSARDGLNTRQSFDGIRSFGKLGRWNYSATVAQAVNTVPDTFDNDSSSDTAYAGASVWTAVGFLPGGNISLYGVFRRRQNIQFDIGRGEDERQTMGLRFWRKSDTLDYNWEGGTQWGEFSNLPIRAWYFASETGYTFHSARARPRLGLRLDATSGDRDPNDGELNTFHSLFGSTSYSGLAGQIGPANVFDIAPSIGFSPVTNVRVNAGAIGFWRVSRGDGIYTITGNLRRSGQLSDARHVGNQLTLQTIYTPSRHWTFLATAAYFNAGRFLEETPPAQDVTYFTAWVSFRF